MCMCWGRSYATIFCVSSHFHFCRPDHLPQRTISILHSYAHVRDVTSCLTLHHMRTCKSLLFTTGCISIHKLYARIELVWHMRTLAQVQPHACKLAARPYIYVRWIRPIGVEVKGYNIIFPQHRWCPSIRHFQHPRLRFYSVSSLIQFGSFDHVNYSTNRTNSLVVVNQ